MASISDLIVIATAVVIILFIAGLLCLRLLDYRADKQLIQKLIAQHPPHPGHFHPVMLQDLPEAAKRFFQFSITPGTPLYTVANIAMTGQFSLGNGKRPDYLNMQARQTLAFPGGFVWQMQARRQLLRISGSDSASWSRFWLQELLPVARVGANLDQRRSAFGRYVAEAIFWTPAAVLPGPGVKWAHLTEHSARLTVTHSVVIPCNLLAAMYLIFVTLAATACPLMLKPVITLVPLIISLFLSPISAPSAGRNILSPPPGDTPLN